MTKNTITIKDIAREAGVSPALVSFVMSNNSAGSAIYRVSDDTSRKVLEVARRHNYKPNNSARALRSGRTNTIGVVLSDVANPFFAELARYMENHAYKYDYSVIIASTDENPEKEKRVIQVLLDKGVDGLIIVPCAGADDIINEIATEGINAVLLDREVEGVELDSFILDNNEAARDITERLISKGASHIDMVSYSMDITNARQREEGYMDAMRRAGLEDVINIHRIAHNNYEGVSDYVRQAKERGVDGFVMATNTLSSLVISSIFKQGYKVPEDFRLACFDRNPLYDIYGKGIIYVSQPIREFAEKAVDSIIEKVRGQGRPGAVRTVLKPIINE